MCEVVKEAESFLSNHAKSARLAHVAEVFDEEHLLKIQQMMWEHDARKIIDEEDGKRAKKLGMIIRWGGVAFGGSIAAALGLYRNDVADAFRLLAQALETKP